MATDDFFRAWPTTAVVDLGYRGVDHLVPVDIIDRGRYKVMTERHRRWEKRRQAIEPMTWHTNHDHGIQRCWLKGANGEALHAVQCALRASTSDGCCVPSPVAHCRTLVCPVPCNTVGTQDRSKWAA